MRDELLSKNLVISSHTARGRQRGHSYTTYYGSWQTPRANRGLASNQILCSCLARQA